MIGVNWGPRGYNVASQGWGDWDKIKLGESRVRVRLRKVSERKGERTQLQHTSSGVLLLSLSTEYRNRLPLQLELISRTEESCSLKREDVVEEAWELSTL